MSFMLRKKGKLKMEKQFTEEEKKKIMLERMKNWELEEESLESDIQSILEFNLPETHQSVIEKLELEILQAIQNYYE
jgi:hypothetical protein